MVTLWTLVPLAVPWRYNDYIHPSPPPQEYHFRVYNYIVLNFQYLQVKNENTASSVSDSMKKVDDRLKKTQTLVSRSTDEGGTYSPTFALSVLGCVPSMAHLDYFSFQQQVLVWIIKDCGRYIFGDAACKRGTNMRLSAQRIHAQKLQRWFQYYVNAYIAG